MRQAAEAKNRDLDLARTQYVQRVAIRDERKKMLDELKTQIEKLKILHDDPETPKVQSMGYAPVPLEISFPKWKAFFPGGTVLGFMLGVGLAFLIELLNDLVRIPKDVVRYLHIPLLGVIPDISEDSLVENIDPCLIVQQAPYSVITESYRRFRAHLKLSAVTTGAKSLLIASCNSGEGGTCASANLAATLAAEGRKVLLIDANLWRPALHKIFRKTTADEQITEHALGLCDFLKGQCSEDEIVKFSGVDGLYVVEAGTPPPNPGGLLCSDRMGELIKRQRDNYDYVIVDGPPVLLVSEAKVLSRFIDGTVLVCNADTTRRGAAQRAIRELREINAAIAGCVLLRVKALKGGYFQEQFKSYQEYQKPLLARAT
jgi:capsular exopolysaccharide synthesis family protein